MQDMLMVRIVREMITIFSENKIDVINYDDCIIEGTMKKQERPKNNKLKSSPKTKSKIHHSKN